jgi:hypothetical protein
MIGTVSTERATTIAADVDGVVQTELIGQVTERRRAQFAYRAEADQWAADMTAEGFTVTWIASAAVNYFGPTDAPGNCWSVTVEKPAAPPAADGCGCWNAVNLGTCIHQAWQQ